MLDFNALHQYSESELISWLQIQDDLYENDSEQAIDDIIYDNVRRYAELSFPANQYFLGVGSDVRGGKVKLPYLMNGLTQLHMGEVNAYQIVPQSTSFIVSEKLDGTSAQVIYDHTGKLQIAFSRGNGIEGADITRHIKQIPHVPKQLNNLKIDQQTFAVRGEVIIRKSNWPIVQSDFQRRNNSTYKNARNATAGIMNASENDSNIYQYIDFVAYTIIDSKLSKHDQLMLLQELHFNTVNYEQIITSDLTDDFLTTAIKRYKNKSMYELDGIVVNHNNSDHSMLQGLSSAFKYKVADESNIAITQVVDVTFTPSKDGYLKPVINFNPVDLIGVTITKCTGFNAGFIFDNKIHPGTFIKITRSGDVIPYCCGIHSQGPNISSFNHWFDKKLSEIGQWEWNATSVDAILTDKSSNKDVQINLLTDIFTKLKISNLKAGNLEALYDKGYTTALDIISLDYIELRACLGEIADSINESLDERLSNIYWPELAGSLNLFGRGVGRKKLTTLYEGIKGDLTRLSKVDEIVNIEGFELTTANQIVKHYDSAMSTMNKLAQISRVTIRIFDPNRAPQGSKMLNQIVVFTGIRSPELEQEIVEQGGTIGSGVSKTTTIVCAKDPNGSSGKIKKAHQLNKDYNLNILIIDIKQLEKMLF